jgi:hypothetical protein
MPALTRYNHYQKEAAMKTYSIERDLKEAEAMASALVPYIYETTLYANIGGLFNSGTLPSLTLGALLLRLNRLAHLALTGSQLDRLRAAQAQYDEVARQWKQHHDDKLVREALSRLNAMNTFFEECRDQPRSCAPNYPPELARRTIVEELRRALEQRAIVSAELDSKTRQIDGKLRRYVVAASFQWDTQLEAAYPAQTYWWLYHRPDTQN